MTITGWAGILDGKIDCVLSEPFEYDSQTQRIYATKEMALEYYALVAPVLVTLDDVDVR